MFLCFKENSFPLSLVIGFVFLVVRGSLELGFSSNSDPEPWRCKRTDGKKWRCSRDVAPDQKYCERHAHKSRPRSRKPVESNPNFINNNNTTTTTTRMRSPRSNFVKNNNSNQPTPLSTNMVSPTVPSHAQPRWVWFGSKFQCSLKLRTKTH